MDKKYLVIGGTDYDTGIGVRLLKDKGYTSFALPLSNDPKDQTFQQTINKNKLELDIIDKIFNIKQSFDEAIVFCNSLSFTLDWREIESNFSFPIHTLIDSYESLTFDSKTIALITGNINTLAQISSFLKGKNNEISILGFAVLPLIEKMESENMEYLSSVLLFYNVCKNLNIKKLIIGCTHFEGEKLEIQMNDLNLFLPGQTLIHNLNL
jgi:glutamate racemase